MIYRAMAYIAGSLDDTHQVVYFETAVRSEADARLRTVLSTTWRLPAERIDYYNLNDEDEVLRCAFSAPDTGDARLLEIGWSDGRPRYAEPESTQFLVGPRAMRRLAAAQRLAGQLQQAAIQAAVQRPIYRPLTNS